MLDDPVSVVEPLGFPTIDQNFLVGTLPLHGANNLLSPILQALRDTWDLLLACCVLRKYHLDQTLYLTMNTNAVIRMVLTTLNLK
jgi:hypothetical protein